MTIDRELRRNRVLEAIVKAHVGNALPVGSKHITRTLGLSSATIRNVMAELEKDGYVTQPYTSAGRVPTDLGYRKYVNNMHSVSKPPADEAFLRVRRYVNRKRFFEEVIEGASQAISEITSYTGIALSPRNKFYFGGTHHMLEQPEFSELETARDFLRVIEEKEELLRLMSEDLETTGTTIRIGRENIFTELRNCTIITCTYKFRQRISGNVGIIGPMRMRYETVVPIVEHLAEITTEALEEIS